MLLWGAGAFSVACAPSEVGEDLTSSTVTVLYPFDERVLGPYWGMEARHLVFLSLLGLAGDSSGETRARLAESWEHSPDYRTWTYHLRPDVRWHDGVPVTAEDVAFTVWLWEHAVQIRPPALDSAEVVDVHTVRFHYRAPTNGLDAYHVYYPKHLLEELDRERFWEWEFWTRPVGNGPFRYVRHLPKTMVELEANPDYYRGEPAIGRVILRFGSQENWLAELLSGNADAVSYVDRVDVIKLADDPRFREYHWWGGWIDAVYWNHRDPRFGDPRVREALTRAMDREELARLLDYPPNLPVYDGPCSDRMRRQDACLPALAHNPDEARRLLERAGWSDSEVDAVREWAGPSDSDPGPERREFAFTALVPSEGVKERAAIFLQEQLGRVGVRMEIATLDLGVLRQRLSAGGFEAAVHPFRNANDFVPSGVGRIVGRDSPTGWENRRAERLAERELSTVAPAARDRIHAELAEILRAELPVTLLLPQVQTHVVHRRIRGLQDLYRADPIWFMEELWIEGRE